MRICRADDVSGSVKNGNCDIIAGVGVKAVFRGYSGSDLPSAAAFRPARNEKTVMRDVNGILYVQPCVAVYSRALVCPQLDVPSVNENRDGVGSVSVVHSVGDVDCEGVV